MKIVFALIFIAAGIGHLLQPKFFADIMPTYIPWTLILPIVYLSGILEIVFGTILIFPQTSVIAAWGLMALLIAVFPANVNLALNPGLTPGFPGWAHWLRLPLQPVLIWWAYQYR
jgi:uncharacterized membrane protein